MNPLTEARNLTPSSTALPSCSVTMAGTAVEGQIVHGQFNDGGDVVVKVAGAAAGDRDWSTALPDASADVTR